MLGGQTFGKQIPLSTGDEGGSHHASELFTDLEFNKSAFETEYFLNRLEALNTGLKLFVLLSAGPGSTNSLVKKATYE